MYKFNISERYRLEVHWKSLEIVEGTVLFEGAYMCGPVLAQLSKINPNDSIRLDFKDQYVLVINNFFAPKLSWTSVTYANDIIELGDAILEDTSNLSRIPKINKTDCIIIDTENHEDDKHMYNLVYTSFIVNDDNNIYRFN